MRYEIKKYWRSFVLAVLAILFFIGTSSFNYWTQDDDFVKWLSPDEAANYTFSKFYAQESEMAIFEKYNLYAGDIMHPRSMRSDNGFIKPVSFLGIILIYGKIASLTSYKILPFLTPFFGALGIIFYYLLVKKIFGKRNALMSACLLTCFPVYIYYSARSMFHNVLFVVLLTIGLYYSVMMAGKKNKEDKGAKLPIGSLAPYLYSALAGGFVGLAIITRTSELLWIAPVLIILWVFNIKKINITKLLVSLCFCAFAFTPVFYWNQVLYGNYWHGGYPEMNQSIAEITQAGSDLIKPFWGERVRQYSDLFANLKNNIFYFGFHPKHSIIVFYNYFVKMFYWLFWPAAFGFVLFLSKYRKWKRRHLCYLAFCIVPSAVLLFYYGSWCFHDNPDPSQFTIGNSYTRYWLLIYMCALPFAGFFITKLSAFIFSWIQPDVKNNDLNKIDNINNPEDEKKIFKYKLNKKFLVNSFVAVIIILMSFISIRFVLFGSEEGLIFTAQRQKESKKELEKIIKLTENNSVIITRYHDKLLFPERKVIIGLFDDKNMVAKYAVLAKYIPVYYYNFTFPQADFDYLNNRRLTEAGLRIEKVEQVAGEFTLYRIDLRNP